MRHSTYLEVNLSLLAKNVELAKNLAPKSRLLPMVKADAYGNGILPISKYLVQQCGIETLGCATLGEAIKLFQECPDLNSRIFVFSDTELDNKMSRHAYFDYKIFPILHQRSDLEIVLNDSFYSKLPLLIKINSGMNRLGLSKEDLEFFIPKLKNRGIRHLMTHFSRSSEPMINGCKTLRQYDEFLKIKEFLNQNQIFIEETSVSNSGAIEQQFGIEETFIRPGLMLYGPSGLTELSSWRGSQISRWVAKILSTFRAKKGTPIGYGVNVADKDCVIAILSVGYGDGFLTYFSGINIMVNGVLGKVFGRVNMDMTFVQFDLSEEVKIKKNDLVEIWDNNPMKIVDLASQTRTIPYQLMCAVSSRIPRIYVLK